MSAILLLTQADRGHPFVNEAGVLPRPHVLGVVDPARECIVVDRAATSFEPSQKASSHVTLNFELDRLPSLLLNDDRAGSDLGSGDQIANPDFD